VRVGQQYGDLLGGLSTENVERIQRQNGRKISVIIGNPPYNANQQNENDENKNRQYPEIDRRISATYVKESTATRTNVYDMYSRFFRWAADRIDDDGIIAFVTNRGFLDQRSYDGFRRLLVQDFNEIYVVDLGGDVRLNPKLSGTTHNVFGIQIGVAITFLVKRHKASGCRIFYGRRPEFELREEKLTFVANTALQQAAPDPIRPDARFNWIDTVVTDFQSLVPLVNKETKAAQTTEADNAIFKRFSMGVVTNRDDWVYAATDEEVATKVNHLVDVYNEEMNALGPPAKAKRGGPAAAPPVGKIKWTRLVKGLLAKRTRIEFSSEHITSCVYRPFQALRLYYSRQLNEMQYRLADFYGTDGKRRIQTIVWSDPTSQKPFMCMAVNGLFDLHLVGAASGAMGAARMVLTGDGSTDNVTDWALAQFRERYGVGAKVTKDGIFAYVYAVLHSPAYRSSYLTDLRRDQPRIPFYTDFVQWRDWGKELLKLHGEYSEVKPFAFTRTDTPSATMGTHRQAPRAVLRSDRKKGIVVVDSETQISGIPIEAWDYSLAGRAAIDWVLDQHKEQAPKDPVIREKFNTYRLANHKEKMISLLGRVVAVSIRTVAILDAMQKVVSAT
jgi:predicted helicase